MVYRKGMYHKSYSMFLRKTSTYLRNRAKTRNIPLSEDMEHKALGDLFEKQNGLCALSGLPMTWADENKHANDGSRRGTNIAVDRIDPNGPYSMQNIRLVCERANKMKSNNTDDDLYFWCTQIAKTLRNS
jgi:hypothetical protein